MCNILSNRSAKTIDVLLSTSIFLGFLANFWGVIKIDWIITSELMHILFIFSSVTLALTFFASLLIMHIRRNNTIFTVWNTSAKFIMYFFGLVNFIGLILVLVCFFYISNDLVAPISNQTKYDAQLVDYIKHQWKIIFYSFTFTVVFYDLQFPLWYSSLERVKAKSNGSLRKGDFVIIEN